MFDIGWTELLLVGVVALFAFGPEDIPKMMYHAGKIMRRFRYMRYALSSQFEDFMEKAESQAKPKPTEPTKIPAKDSHEFDESEADEYLMDMIPPPPETIPDKEVILPDEPDTKPKPATAE